VIGPIRDKQGRPVYGCGEKRLEVRRPEELQRMRIKRHDNCRSLTRSRLRTYFADERRVAPVHAVEIPDGHCTSTEVRGRHLVPINRFNRHVLDRPASSRTTNAGGASLMIAMARAPE
jgi:hypothetical protein